LPISGACAHPRARDPTATMCRWIFAPIRNANVSGNFERPFVLGSRHVPTGKRESHLRTRALSPAVRDHQRRLVIVRPNASYYCILMIGRRAPKGRNLSALGNALGKGKKGTPQALKGRLRPTTALEAPFQG